MVSDDLHARVQCKITRVLQWKLKMDPSRAGSDPNSARLGRIRPCFSPLGGASEPFWADLGVHPTCFRSIWGCKRLGWTRSDPMISICFENGPDPRRIRPGFGPTWLGPTVPGSTCGCFRPVLGRFGDASNLFVRRLGGTNVPSLHTTRPGLNRLGSGSVMY